MNKIALGLLLMGMNAFAANTHEIAVIKEKVCGDCGTLRQMGAEARITKKVSREKLAETFKENLELQEIALQGYDSKETAKEAFMMGWAKCQDKFS